MSNATHTRCVGVLVVALGLGVAAMTHPGIGAADPAAEPPPGASQGESPGPGGPDSKTEPGVVSSGGSTPPAGAGSVGAGSGSDESSGPDQAAESTGSNGSTDVATESTPGVVVRSSGGALTSNEYQQAEPDLRQPDPEQATPGDSSVLATTPEGQVVAPASGMAATTATAESGATSRGTKTVVVHDITDVSSLRAPIRSTVVAGGDPQPFAVGRQASGEAVDVESMAARREVPEPERSSRQPLQTFTAVLVSTLAPLVLPLPGDPLEEPTLWALLAWVRRQFERNTLDHRPAPMVDPRQTEMVVADEGADAPGAVVDRTDRATGRVTGHVNAVDVSGDERDGLTYALVKQVDRRVGVVTVDGATGQWAFAPNQSARLIAQPGLDGDTATFSVAASNGWTTDVRASVVPAEAVVTDAIDIGAGLTYGLAAVGDRLYVLNGSADAAGNGSVKIIDTVTKTLVGSIDVGSMPFAMVASGRSLYVGNADDGTVSVLDVDSNRVVDVIEVGANPFGLEVTGDRLYVADHAGTVSVIDVNDNSELVRIPVGGDPFAVAVTADRVYVTDYSGGTVAVVDTATNTADSTDVAGYPYSAAVVGGRLYVVNSATNALTIVDRSITTTVDVDPRTRAVDAIPVGAAPIDVVVRGDRMYVSNINCGTVTVIDVATNQLVESIGVGIQPGLMTATRDGRTIYVADVMGGIVRVITSVRHAAA